MIPFSSSRYEKLPEKEASMNKRIVSVAALGAALMVAAAAAAQPPSPLGAGGKAVVTGNNVFAFDLYAQLRQEKGNLFFSPYSISNALAMTYAGARGETAKQMAQTLHFGLAQDDLHTAFSELVKHFNKKSPQRKYQLSVANRLWGQKGYTFLPAFLKVTEDQYGAGLDELDFAGATEKARQTINAWVEKETQDKIKELIKQGVLLPDTRLVLTNAIYFKAPWLESFSEKATKEEMFTTAAGDKVKVPMMRKGDRMSYMAEDTFHAVAIPYAGHELSMVVLLPKKVDGLTELERQLTSANLDAWLKKMQPYQVDLKLPRFKNTSEFNLKKVLSKMGMALAFADSADFTGMTSQEKLKIDEVIHKAFVDVNEKGTEAAAATAVIMLPTSAVINPKTATFHADHPFLYLIRENQTGSILFMGRVEIPQK
jgi:serpin B